ncbi:hypothetical protein CryarDRAFT_0981 [Cryptosporangium arvum DSM 44712]|uniref:Uncharacterized protein n=1 Tax=Cryptosporangium arvum DSM 44712 TaxID=927661 RepID=A0A010YXK9_9ACTN|nr:hypothetical protein CryarDRAFT_0981 [Cryptosporangium arvum DSM 44712]
MSPEPLRRAHSAEEDARPWDVRVDEGGPVNVVPESVRDAARRAFDARPVDTLVADLMFDSILDHDRRAAADPTVRTMRFGHRSGGADLRVTDQGSGRRISLEVLPAQRASAEVRCAGSTFTITTDDDGRAEFDVPIGLFSLVLRPLRSPQAKPLQTSWVRL